MAIFDRPQSYQVAQAKETQRGVGIDLAAKQEEVAYQVASLFLDAENAARNLTAAQRQAETLALVKPLVDAQVQEDRLLPIESDRANLAILIARQQVDTLNTTLISGSYGDTSTVVGSISIHVIGDTTLTYSGNQVLVTYVDGSGNTYNSAGDSSDAVTITRFPKTENGIVAGSFHVTVTGTAGSLVIAAGSFAVPFLD